MTTFPLLQHHQWWQHNSNSDCVHCPIVTIVVSCHCHHLPGVVHCMPSVAVIVISDHPIHIAPLSSVALCHLPIIVIVTLVPPLTGHHCRCVALIINITIHVLSLLPSPCCCHSTIVLLVEGAQQHWLHALHCHHAIIAQA